MTELIELLDGHPSLIWIVLVFTVGTYVVKQVVESSEHASKLLGRLGSRWKRKAERVAAVEALRLERESSGRSSQNAINDDLLQQVKYLRERLEQVIERNEEYDLYYVYDAEWHSSNEIYAAEHGYDFPPPKHMTFNEFRRKADGWKA